MDVKKTVLRRGSAQVRIVLLIGHGSRVPAILECAGKINGVKVVYVLSCIGEGVGTETARLYGIKTGILKWQDYKSRANGRNDFATRTRNLLKSYQADLVVMAGWMVIMPPSFVWEFNGRVINIHPSILPAYPGKAENVIPAQWRNKAVPAGCTLHYVDEGVDSGEPIEFGYVISKKSDYKRFSFLEQFAAAIHAKEDEVLCRGIRKVTRELQYTK